MSGGPQTRAADLFDYEEQFTARYDFPEFSARPRVYIIATTPRSGSHYLGHALWQSGHFGAPLEYLHRKNYHRWQELSGSEGPQALFGWLARRRTSPSGWFGIKLMWRQFDRWQADAQLPFLPPVTRILHLYRRDLLGQAVSFRIAQDSGIWAAGMAGNGRSPQFDHAAIVRAAESLRRQNRGWHRVLNEPAWAEVPRFSLAYEDLAADPEAMLRRISEFLDPDGPALSPSDRTARQSGDVNAAWRQRVRDALTPAQAWVARPHDWHLDRRRPPRWRQRLPMARPPAF